MPDDEVTLKELFSQRDATQPGSEDEDRAVDNIVDAVTAPVAPLVPVKRRCGPPLGSHNNPLGRTPKYFGKRRFFETLKTILMEPAEDTDPDGPTKFEKAVRNLYRMSISEDQKRADAAIRALQVIAGITDTPPPKPLPGSGETGNVKIVLVNATQQVLSEKPEPKKLTPVFIKNLPEELE